MYELLQKIGAVPFLTNLRRVISMIPVVNRHRSAPVIGDVYIGRPSKFGNPYKIDRDGTREEVIAKFRRYITDNPQIIDALIRKRPMRLVCFCAPLSCHGDVYAEILEARGYMVDAAT